MLNQEEIIRLAQEAGYITREFDGEFEVMDGDNYHIQTDIVERFAALVAAHEREECAKVCEPQEIHDDPLTAWKIATAIRARGTK